MLSCLNCTRQQGGTHLRRTTIKEYGVIWICKGRLHIFCNASNTVAAGQLPYLFSVTADQDGIGHYPISIRQSHAALFSYRHNRPDEVLVIAHAPSDAMHNDAYFSSSHNNLIQFLTLVIEVRPINHISRIDRCQGLRE